MGFLDVVRLDRGGEVRGQVLAHAVRNEVMVKFKPKFR
jgi:hypothetical protein